MTVYQTNFNIQNITELCLKVEDDEDNLVVVKIDKNMTREDVVSEILKKIG